MALFLLVSIDDATAGEVVGRKLHDHSVVRQDADVVHAHLAADVGKHLVAVVELNTEHRVRQGLKNRSLELDCSVFLGHEVRATPQIVVPVGLSGW